MKLTLGLLDDLIYKALGDDMEKRQAIEQIPVTLCRYNTEQVIDRVVIQIRGELGVTIHTADVGGKS